MYQQIGDQGFWRARLIISIDCPLEIERTLHKADVLLPEHSTQLAQCLLPNVTVLSHPATVL